MKKIFPFRQVTGKRPLSDNLQLIIETARTIAPDREELSEWSRNYLRRHYLRITDDLELVRTQASVGAKLLDVGCIPPLLVSALRKLGFDIIGIDIAPERYQTFIAESGITVHKCDIERERLPFADDDFDLVVFSELFEHLRIDPPATMKEVLRILKPGGLLLISTPNLRSLQGIINLLIHNKSYSCCSDVYGEYQKLHHLGHMGHVREYTAIEVSEFLAKVGFETKKIIYKGSYNSLWSRAIGDLVPGLRPFMTIIAAKGRG